MSDIVERLGRRIHNQRARLRFWEELFNQHVHAHLHALHPRHLMKAIELGNENYRLRKELEDTKADYLRRHQDATDRYLEIERLRTLLSAAEQRGKDARRVAIEDCAKVAILTANHLTILPPSVRKFPEVGGIIAARILELSTPVEEKIDEVSG